MVVNLYFRNISISKTQLIVQDIFGEVPLWYRLELTLGRDANQHPLNITLYIVKLFIIKITSNS